MERAHKGEVRSVRPSACQPPQFKAKTVGRMKSICVMFEMWTKCCSVNVILDPTA
jgi:hypothetical protein